MEISKNYLSPFFFIFIVPILLFLILRKTSKSDKIFPNKFSVLTFIILFLYAFASLKLFPQNFTGPTNVDGFTPSYQGNGFLYYLVSLTLTFLVCFTLKDFPLQLRDNFIPFIMTCNIFGFLFVLYLYFKDKDDYYQKEEDDKQGMSSLFKFYRGLKFHPRILNVDIKQLTNCRFGMMLWQFLIIIFGFASYQVYGWNLAIWVSIILQSIYIAKFFYWETGYFNTLDITLDRGGYYICWGCLVFLPVIYTFTTYYLSYYPSYLNSALLIGILCLGLYFIYLNYQVDAQKEQFKADNQKEIWGEKPKFLEKDGRKLLLSGWWGKTRHMNYTFEIGLSACWCAVALPLGVLPFTYLFYIIALLVHRIYRDEKKCSDKYGDFWKEYCGKVAYRLIPNIY